MKNILAGASALAIALSLTLAASVPANAEGDSSDPSNSTPPTVVSDVAPAPAAADPVAAPPAAPPAADPAPAVAHPPAAPAADPVAPPVADPPAAPPADPAATDPAATNRSADPAASDRSADPAATNRSADPAATGPAATGPAATGPAVADLWSDHPSHSDDLINVSGYADATDQTCRHGDLVDGRIEVDVTTGVKYVITNSDDEVISFDAVSGKTHRLPSGRYTVAVSALDGYRLTSEHTFWLFIHSDRGECGDHHHHHHHDAVAVTGNASSTAQTCVNDALVDGSITVDVTKGVDYEVTNSNNEAIPFNATTGQTGTLPSGDYTVSVSAQKGYKLKSDDTVRLSVRAFTGDCQQLVTHPLVTPTLSSAAITCTAPGSYTLDAVEGVIWMVNRAVVPAGSYPVASAQTVNVVAETASSDVGFEQNAQTTWQLVFAAATDCVQVTALPTLASTGMQGGGVVQTVLSGLLFLLAGAGVYTFSWVRSRNR